MWKKLEKSRKAKDLSARQSLVLGELIFQKSNCFQQWVIIFSTEYASNTDHTFIFSPHLFSVKCFVFIIEYSLHISNKYNVMLDTYFRLTTEQYGKKRKRPAAWFSHYSILVA